MKTRWIAPLGALCAAASAHANLLGFYEFNDGTATDKSGNGNHGIMGGGAQSNGTTLTIPYWQPDSGLDGTGGFLFTGFEWGNERKSIKLPIDIRTTSSPIVTMGMFAKIRYVYADSFNPAVNPRIQQLMSADDGGFDREIGYDPRATNGSDPNWPWRWSAFGGNQGVISSDVRRASAWRMVALRHNQTTGQFSLRVSEIGGLSTQVDQSGVFYDASSRDFIRLGTSATPDVFDEPMDGWLDNAFVLNEWLSDAQLDEVFVTRGQSLVPEPATLSVLALGALIVARRRRR